MTAVLTTTFDSITDSNAVTITLASLATSSTLLAGRASTVVDNTSGNYLDFIVNGQITIGTSPTASKQINVYVFTPLKVASSTFTYPQATTTALTGSDAAATFEIEQLNNLKIAAVSTNVGTTDRPYSFNFNIVSVLGYCPLKWGLFVTHNTAVNLNSTAGNHWFHWTGIKNTIT